MISLLTLAAALWGGVGNPASLWAQVETFEIPRLTGVTIDGNFSDWDEEPGLGVEVLLQEEGTLKEAEDHNVSFRVGWTPEGLLILVDVQDDNWVEFPEKQKYYNADVIEVFLAERRGAEDVCQWYVTPGMTEAVPEPGVRFRELRRGPTKGMPAELVHFRERLGPNRYRMEMQVPFSGIGKQGEEGLKFAFQLWVNDKDAGSSRRRYLSTFYPLKGASYATQAMHNFRLVDREDPALRISAKGQYDTRAFRPFVRLWAREERVGSGVTVKQGDEVVGQGVLEGESQPGRAVADVAIPPAPSGEPYQDLDVYVGDRKVNTLSLPYSDVIGSLEAIHREQDQYRQRFGLDEPWRDLDDQPLLDRHRGLAAAGLNLLAEDPPPSTEKEMEILSTMMAMLEDLDRGEDYFGKLRNCYWGYYYCRADGTGQRFALAMPRDFDPDRRYPLYLNLHGNGGRPVPSKTESRKEGYFELRPWGRGDISYFGLGEVDVLESLDHVLKWYPVDPDRVALGGHSMGGNATWDLASKYANRFASLVPKAGRSGDDYYENFRHLPALIQHGAKDYSQPVDFGRYTVSRLEQLGFSVLYKEFPEDGHGIRNPFPVEEWFVNQRRPRSPKVITYTCDTPTTGEIYWANLRRFQDPHRPASVRAEVEGQRVSLELPNVGVVELDLEALPSDRSRALVLALEGGEQEIEVSSPQPPSVTLVRQEGESWTRDDDWQAPASEKRRYLPGGAGNLYSGEPLLLVWPSEGPEESRAILEEAARSLERFGGNGPAMITGKVPLKADRDVTEEDLQHRNLVLFGGPEFNTVTRRIAEGLPVTVNDQGQFVIEGEPTADVASSSLTLTTVNPWASKRLVHVIWQDEIPLESRAAFVRRARMKLPGSSGRYPHQVPDLQLVSREPALTIRRQFTEGWTWRPREGVDRMPDPAVVEVGIEKTRLRVMKEKAGVDFTLHPDASGWGAWMNASPSLEEFRFRNYRTTTFVASLKGADLEALLANPAPARLMTWPAFEPGSLEPDRVYRIVAPEAILWSCRTLRGVWFDMEAGPDLEADDYIRVIYPES